MARILIIDDNILMRHMISECLDTEHEIVMAQDGREGLEVALKVCPDLIICDVVMPHMDGFAVFSKLQAAMVDVPFIFLSASADHSAIRHAMGLGADDFLRKPFSVAELVHVVTMRLEKHAHRKMQLEKAVDDLRVSVVTSLPHELRTSIMIVEGYADLLLNTEIITHPEQWNMIKAIQENAIRLRFVSEKYLWYLKTQLQDWRSLKKKQTSVDQIIRTVTTNVAQRFERSDCVTLFLNPCTMVIESEAIEKAIEELVENAFKFSRPQSAVSIFGMNTEPSRYSITIVNFGRGITQDQIERINGFVQFDRHLYEQQGAGLGLIIAKRLIEYCGGQFTIESSDTVTKMIINIGTHRSGESEPSLTDVGQAIMS